MVSFSDAACVVRLQFCPSCCLVATGLPPLCVYLRVIMVVLLIRLWKK